MVAAADWVLLERFFAVVETNQWVNRIMNTFHNFGNSGTLIQHRKYNINLLISQS